MSFSTRVVDVSDPDALARWDDAVARAFSFYHQRDAAERDERRAVLDGRTLTGVYDDAARDPLTPVATLSAWSTTLTTPGAEVAARAVSEITVAISHQGRGLARGLVHNALADAAGAGIPIVAITASEATIYGRFGFAAATWEQELEVDVARLQWRGPAPAGVVHTVEPGDLIEDAPAIYARARPTGAIGRLPAWWRQALRFTTERAFGHGNDGHTLALRYDDENGVAQGYVLYRILHKDGRVTELAVDDLIVATDAARVALWRHFSRSAFVTTVRLASAPLDEPLGWQVGDSRALRTVARTDGLWLRIVDLPGALTGRRYLATGTLVLDVEDSLGYLSGAWKLDVAVDGSAQVERVEAGADVPQVRLGAEELAAVYLGGVGPSTLIAAGRVSGDERGLARFRSLFAVDAAPYLGTHF